MKFQNPFMLRKTHEAQRRTDVRDFLKALRKSVLDERARCRDVAANQRPTGRAVDIRTRVLDGIDNGPDPVFTHPAAADEPEAPPT